MITCWIGAKKSQICTYAAIGYAYTRKYDDPTAITYYEKSVELDPSNGVTRGQLEQLKMYQRKR